MAASSPPPATASSSTPLLARESQGSFVSEPSLRSVLSDPLSGAFLEDAIVLLCGHSFGGLMLKKVIEMARCTICNGEVDPATLFPNLVFGHNSFKSSSYSVKMEDDRRLFHNAALLKRRKEVTERMDVLKSTGGSKVNGELVLDAENSTSPRGVQYPFVVGERVLILGNRRTPDKFVGKQAVITSQCLNGWYLVKAVDSGESIRLQYRSLKKKNYGSAAAVRDEVAATDFSAQEVPQWQLTIAEILPSSV